MLKCEKCGRNKVYVCSDKKNAWCQSGCGTYAHFNGVLFYLGKDLGQYPIKDDGSIRKIKYKQEGNKEITESERLQDLEIQFKELVKTKLEEDNNYWDASSWWSNLPKIDKIKIFKLSKEGHLNGLCNKH